jgi:hypothetical protein
MIEEGLFDVAGVPLIPYRRRHRGTVDRAIQSDSPVVGCQQAKTRDLILGLEATTDAPKEPCRSETIACEECEASVCRNGLPFDTFGFCSIASMITSLQCTTCSLELGTAFDEFTVELVYQQVRDNVIKERMDR